MSDIWQQALRHIEHHINRHSFYTWFKPTRLAEDNDNTLTVVVPNKLFADWFQKHYGQIIRDALASVGRESAIVIYVSDIGDGTLVNRAEGTDSRIQISTDRSTQNLETGATASNIQPPALVGSRTTRSTDESPWPREPLGLNSRYSFDSFVVGPSNQFAHAACRAIAEAPARSYNPLFLYGGVGLGKTHLMHAIGNYLVQTNANMAIVYVSSERFMNEMINALRYERILDFRERYRNVDVLLVDDIQFLGGKESTQTEFFHTFNALFESAKQIVISSDCPPHQISSLEDRLRSRFEWGLIADIQPPDLETRLAILRRRLQAEDMTIPDDVIHFVARSMTSNIREIEGAITRLTAYAKTLDAPVALPLARRVLRDLVTPETRSVVTFESIVAFVSSHYGVTTLELTSRTRSRRASLPRRLAIYMARLLITSSAGELAARFGSTRQSVVHSIRYIERQRLTHRDLDALITSFLDHFGFDGDVGGSRSEEAETARAAHPRDYVSVIRRYCELAGVAVAQEREAELCLTGSDSILAPYLPTTIQIVVDTVPSLADIDRCVDSSDRSAKGPGGYRLVLLAYRDPPDPAGRGQIAVVRSTKRVVILPVSIDEMERAVAAGVPGASRSLAEAFDSYVGERDLFDARTAVADELLAFGRAGQLARIRTSIEHFQSVGVFGLRKTGKTTLLNQLRWTCRHLPVAIVDLQGYAGQALNQRLLQVDESLHRLAMKVRVVLPTKLGGKRHYLQVLRTYAEAFNQAGFSGPIVLCLDEPERMLPLPAPHLSKQSLARRATIRNRFFGLLRAACQEGLIALVVTDIRTEVNRVNRWSDDVDTNPLYQLLREEHLSMLAPTETRQMILEIGLLMDRTFESEALDEIVAESGGHPFIARQLASLAVHLTGDHHIRSMHAKRAIDSALDRSETLDGYLRDVCADLLKRGGPQSIALIKQMARSGGRLTGEAFASWRETYDGPDGRHAHRAIVELDLAHLAEPGGFMSVIRLLDRYLLTS